MSGKNLQEFWKAQKSLTEWLEDIAHKDAAKIRREDNDKRERLKVLNNIIGLPFDQPVQFDGLDLANKTSTLKKFLDEHGQELCALRLMPKTEDLPKLRMRGRSVKEAYRWFQEQDIDASKYRADFVPHSDNTVWATIFVVNKHGVQGEITHGGHHELTQGFHETEAPAVFKFDFHNWSIQPENAGALAYARSLANYLLVKDLTKQKKLQKELDATFSNDYLEGYFESTHTEEFGTWFIDYSSSLGKMYDDMNLSTDPRATALVSGQTGSPGKAEGKICIVEPDQIDPGKFPDGSVLVCSVTTPDYVPLMQKAVAIVTDQGGILSHAAIIARELKVPCIVGTQNATSVLKNSQAVAANADAGTVTIV